MADIDWSRDDMRLAAQQSLLLTRRKSEWHRQQSRKCAFRNVKRLARLAVILLITWLTYALCTAAHFTDWLTLILCGLAALGTYADLTI